MVPLLLVGVALISAPSRGASAPLLLSVEEWLDRVAPDAIPDARLAGTRVLVAGSPTTAQVHDLLLRAADGEVRLVHGPAGEVRFFGRRFIMPPMARDDVGYCATVEAATQAYFADMADLLAAYSSALESVRSQRGGKLRWMPEWNTRWQPEWRQVLDRPQIPLGLAPQPLASMARAAAFPAGRSTGEATPDSLAACRCRLATVVAMKFYYLPGPDGTAELETHIVDNGWYNLRCDSLYGLRRNSTHSAAMAMGVADLRCPSEDWETAAVWLSDRGRMPVVIWNWPLTPPPLRIGASGAQVLAQMSVLTGTRALVAGRPNALVLQRYPPWPTPQLFMPNTVFIGQHEKREMIRQLIDLFSATDLARKLAENSGVLLRESIPAPLIAGFDGLLSGPSRAERNGRQFTALGFRLFVKLYVETPWGALVEQTPFETPVLPPPYLVAELAGKPSGTQ